MRSGSGALSTWGTNLLCNHREIPNMGESDCGNFFNGSVNTARKSDPVKMRHKQLSTAYLTLDSLFYLLLLMSKMPLHNSRDFLKFRSLGKIETGRLQC